MCDVIEIGIAVQARHPLVELSFTDGAKRRGNGIDLLLGAVGQHAADGNRQQRRCRKPPDETAEQGRADMAHVAIIAADQEHSLRNRPPQRKIPIAFLVRPDQPLVVVCPERAPTLESRNALDIAGDELAVLVDEIEDILDRAR